MFNLLFLLSLNSKLLFSKKGSSMSYLGMILLTVVILVIGVMLISKFSGAQDAAVDEGFNGLRGIFGVAND